ncbi:hypothetical protein JKP88DRAFT_353481 [Tribonema minus]|uniref:Uncharacterized protein n=1 Tax=Tribonema minus TaxID=303371 RepID=A0A836CIU2_9STRA|nr:hypothetical protein JKP88DRAFT_353481 [Tribonema minus]
MHVASVCVNFALMSSLLPASAFSAAAAMPPSSPTTKSVWMQSASSAPLHRASPALHGVRAGCSAERRSRLATALRMSGGAAADDNTVASTSGRSSFGLASAWGVLSVLAILGNAVKRLAPIAMQPFKSGDLTRAHWGMYVGFAVLMAYAEGYKAFQKKFSPMVVQRALTLDKSAGPLRLVLAGPYSMGLFHASRKRKIVSWTLSFAVLGLVQAVRKLPYPWRSIIDGGVVAGLSWGSGAIVYYWVRSWFGTDPGVDAQLPLEEPAKTE